MKRYLLAMMLIVVMLVMTGCNYTMWDTTWAFDYAMIALPDGEWVEGQVEAWKDFEDGDQLQVKIDGVTYLTNSTNVVLMHGMEVPNE